MFMFLIKSRLLSWTVIQDAIADITRINVTIIYNNFNLVNQLKQTARLSGRVNCGDATRNLEPHPTARLAD